MLNSKVFLQHLLYINQFLFLRLYAVANLFTFTADHLARGHLTVQDTSPIM